MSDRPRVELRGVERSDLDAIFEHSSDPESNQLAKVHPRGRAAFDTHWDKILTSTTTIARTIVVVDDQGDPSVVGNINAFEVGDETHIGYWVGRAWWGRGVATAALARFLEIVETRPLIAHVAQDNRGSCRVLEKCGFEPFGELESPETERFMACVERIYRLS